MYSKTPPKWTMTPYHPAFVGVFQKHVFRLDVAVQDPETAQKFEREEHLHGEPANQPMTHSLEVIVLNELVQDDAEQLKGYAQVVPKQAVDMHLHYVLPAGLSRTL